MTNRDILASYLKGSNGAYLKAGNPDNFEPLLPYVIMDLVYQDYTDWVKNIECVREAKKFKNEWRAAYNLFNHQFFSKFNDDEVYYIVEKMVKFRKDIGNEYAMARISISNECKHLEYEDQMRIIAILMCGAMTEAAQCVWGNTYTHGSIRCVNPQIKNIGRIIDGFRKHYRIGDRNINVNLSKSVDVAVNKLCHSMIGWLQNN